MISREHYFDWAATSPSDEEIIRKAMEISLEHWGNPSSIHEAGVDARKALEEARQRCARAMGVKSEHIYFTSGGTESDHIPLVALLSRPAKGNIILSAIEHPALREMTKPLENTGWKVKTVNPDKDGFVTPEAVASLIDKDTAFISIMAVNNETGAVQDIYGISDAITKKTEGKRRPFFHVDCVQAAGKIPVNLAYKGIDSASFSAHKIGGPRGIGILYLTKEINSFLKGGGQEKNVRSGTENLFGATAFAMCLEKYFISTSNTKAMERYNTQLESTKRFIENLMEIPKTIMIPHCRGKDDSKNFSPWVIQCAFPGIPGQVMERALSTEGYYISTGSACSSKSHARPVLDTMQIPPEEKESAVRFSFGHETTQKAIDELLETVEKIRRKFL